MTEPTQGGGGSYRTKFIALVIVFALVVIILIQNSNPVAFRFLFWGAQVSQVVLILILLAIGFAAGFLVGVTRRRGD